MKFSLQNGFTVVQCRFLRQRHVAVLCMVLAMTVFNCAFAPHLFAKGAGPRLPQPGFRSIGLWNPAVPIRMDIAVWYPTPRTPRNILLDGWAIRVGQDGMPTPGKYPVILLSHTTAGSRLASHDLAAHLARNGFVVIAPTHPRDNTHDTSGIYHADLFADRPNDLLLALEAVEKNTVLHNIVDRNRIGVLGVGSGAATALQLAGTLPDLSRLNLLCEPSASVSDNPFCSQWAKLFHTQMQTEFASLLNGGPEKFIPVIVPRQEPPSGNIDPVDLPTDAMSKTEQNTPPSMPEGATNATPHTEGREPVHPQEQSVSDPRIVQESPQPAQQPVLAIGLLTPGLIDLFPDASLNAITPPVGILAVANDTVYPSEKSLDRLQKALPQRPASRILQNAGHFDVQAPCPPMYAESFPALCGNQSSSAENLRAVRNEFFVRFFQKTLGPPGPPPVTP